MVDIVNKIIMLLSKGMSNRKLYFSDHPRVDSYAAEIVELANEFFYSSNSQELYIGIIDGFFVFDGKRVFGPSVTGKQLIAMAKILHCGGFGLKRGINIVDVKKFFDVTALKVVPVKKIGDARSLFDNYGITTIRIGDPYTDKAAASIGSKGQNWKGQAIGGGLQSPTFLYQELYDFVSKAYGNAAAGSEVNVEQAQSVSEFMLKYIQTNFADVMQYVHYPDYDSYTVGHSVRVASLAVYAGSKMGWNDKDLLSIGAAGLLHDIGKSIIPDEILLKKGKLTEEEYGVIKDHPRAGAEILMEQEGVTELDIAACWGHHIRHDGGGYPAPPLWAVRHPVTSLLQICDVFEALTAIRPYKPALNPQIAYSIMLGDKGAFHPGIFASFISMVTLYPPGTYVRLTDRKIGMVVEVTEAIDRPNLLITAGEGGHPMDTESQYYLNLNERKNGGIAVEKLLLDYLD
ncbi:MAG: putative nucleotidyltransferase with HDIG domain [Desulforhopalus sp.]|jgi:putative nucleotidyltransferase with HDIG domain